MLLRGQYPNSPGETVEHVAVINGIYSLKTEKYGECCWVVVNQYSNLEDDPDDIECPIYGSHPDVDGVRLFPLASDNHAWKVKRVIHLVKHPSRPNRFIWNTWIWKELSQSPDHGPGSTPYYRPFTRVGYCDDDYSSDSEGFSEYSDEG